MMKKAAKTNKSLKTQPSKKIWKKWWFWVIVIVFIGAMGTGNSSDNTTESEVQVATNNAEKGQGEPQILEEIVN